MKEVTRLVVAILWISACSGTEAIDLPDLPNGGQAVSLSGDTLYPPAPSPEAQARMERELRIAAADYIEHPNSPSAIIWLGRRNAYLGKYRQAIRIYTQGISKYPSDARMYRHRGHRFITLRMLDRAIADLQTAAGLTEGREDEVEPDGQPNEAGIPTSTLQFNIWYHLGLAYYLKGDFENALNAYAECMERSDIPDRLVATSHWMYMTLRRLGRVDQATELLAAIDADMEIIENVSYHRLLLMYKGELTPEELMAPGADAVQSATVAYGVGNWYYYNQMESEAFRIFRDILKGDGWAAFGYIAAEAELSAPMS
jgi:tetratricopeptide (TPR) repeat protein